MDRLARYPGLGRIEPRLEILADAQLALWPRLTGLPPDVVLYGGTALALRLGHRRSVDFDFFVPRSFQPDELRRMAPILRDAPPRQSSADTLVVEMDGVRVAIYGVMLPALHPPDLAGTHGLPIASLADLGATKVKATLDRAETKDYLDISALLTAGMDLGEMLGGAVTLFGPAFSPMLALKALMTFDDGDLASLEEEHRQILTEAARSVRRIPVVGARLPALLPAEGATTNFSR